MIVCTPNSVIDSHLVSSKCSNSGRPLQKEISEESESLFNPLSLAILIFYSPITVWG